MDLKNILIKGAKVSLVGTAGLVLGTYIVIGSVTGEWNPSESFNAIREVVEQGERSFFELDEYRDISPVENPKYNVIQRSA